MKAASPMESAAGPALRSCGTEAGARGVEADVLRPEVITPAAAHPPATRPGGISMIVASFGLYAAISGHDHGRAG